MTDALLLADDPGMLRNRLFGELAVGDAAALERTVGAADIQLFAIATTDAGAAQLDPDYAQGTPNREVIAHDMWGAALFASLINNHLPGPGSVIIDQTFVFHGPAMIGDTLTARATVTALDASNGQVTLSFDCVKQGEIRVISGHAVVAAPTTPVSRVRKGLPTAALSEGVDGMQSLMDAARALGPVRVAVVHPCDAISLAGALDARTARLINPILVGPRARIEAVAQEAGLNLAGIDIEDVPHSHAAAATAAGLAAMGKVEALMKGSLHTDELMGAIVGSAAGLRTKRRITHCFVMQTPFYPRPLIITDAAVNISPDLETKADIARNAIDLAIILGISRPRLAVLAAVETVNPQMQATLDAAALCKMADRGQITGAEIDGPLAFDNAISPAASRIKGIVSPVAGRADILLVPDLESGNMLAKQLEYLGGAKSAGIVLGARIPIVLTSRADSRESRVTSCAIAVLIAHHYRKDPI